MAITTIWHDTREPIRPVARVAFIESDPSQWDDLPFRELGEILSGTPPAWLPPAKTGAPRGRKRKPGLKIPAFQPKAVSAGV